VEDGFRRARVNAGLPESYRQRIGIRGERHEKHTQRQEISRLSVCGDAGHRGGGLCRRRGHQVCCPRPEPPEARVTVFHDGGCVHNNLDIEGTTSHKIKAKYTPHGDGPIGLQDHGNPISFGNIWVRELPEEPYLTKWGGRCPPFSFRSRCMP
jgi:hypothetical protein